MSCSRSSLCGRKVTKRVFLMGSILLMGVGGNLGGGSGASSLIPLSCGDLQCTLAWFRRG
jgi:hypothetical protein